MAHHGRTPQSVLNAPKPRVAVISRQDGPNRAARRALPGLPAIPKNEPYVRPVKRGAR